MPPPLCVLAQSLEEAYDPCATEPDSLPENTNFLMCEETCSDGYCFEDPANNAGIPLNGFVVNKTIEISGVYRITRSANFRNCHFKMLPGAQILIEPVTEISPVVVFNNCEFLGCEEMWFGIHINASAVSKLNFVFEGCNIQDAFIALNLYEGKNYNYLIQDSEFINNCIGVSNRRQNNSITNAVFLRNNFSTDFQLKPRSGYMSTLAMFSYPFAWAGMRFVSTTVSVGAAPTLTVPATTNTFSQFRFNGIITHNTWLSSIHNRFNLFDFNTDSRGISVTDKGAEILNNSFDSAGYYAIFTNHANLRTEQNLFEGLSHNYIECRGNSNAEQIKIVGNNFQIDSCNVTTGINVQRPSTATGVSCQILENSFYIDTSASLSTCIYVTDFYGSSTDEMHINGNGMIFDFPSRSGTGVHISYASSGGMRILDNGYFFHSSTAFDGFGYSMRPTFGSFENSDNLIQGNTSYGDLDESVSCGFHIIKLQGTNFCDNIVSHSIRGFHFNGNNDISLTQNSINYHTYGLLIEDQDGRIGDQSGKGNQWNLDEDACTNAAARFISSMGSDPMNSQFTIPEDTDLPFFPPTGKIFPSGPWFTYDDLALLDYCITDNPLPKYQDAYITPYEEEVIADTSVLTDAALWDLQRQTYTKLLLNASLRPTSSPAETYFNSYSGTQIDSFGRVQQQITNALQLISIYQPTLDSLRGRIQLTSNNLQSLDSITDFSDTLLVTGTYFPDRDSLLDIISMCGEVEFSLEESRIQLLDSLLANALDLNTNIHTTQTWETSHKLANDIHLRFLLGQPMTEIRYEQLLSLAQRDRAVAGEAAQGVISYLAPCDQLIYGVQVHEEEPEEEGRPASILAEKYKNIPAIKIAPNPTNGRAQISLSGEGGFFTVLDVLGKRLVFMPVEKGAQQIDLDLKSQAAGLFYAILSDQSGRVIDSSSILLQR